MKNWMDDWLRNQNLFGLRLVRYIFLICLFRCQFVRSKVELCVWKFVYELMLLVALLKCLSIDFFFKIINQKSFTTVPKISMTRCRSIENSVPNAFKFCKMECVRSEYKEKTKSNWNSLGLYQFIMRMQIDFCSHQKTNEWMVFIRHRWPNLDKNVLCRRFIDLPKDFIEWFGIWT